MPTYSERKKFWEKMSLSQSGEPPIEIHHDSIESMGSVAPGEADKKIEKSETIIAHEATTNAEIRRSFDEGGLVKSLTESFTKKIAEVEPVKLATPRPKSLISIKSSEVEADAIAKAHDISKLVDSPGTDHVSELEVKMKLQSPSVPITESAVISGDTELNKQILEKAEFTTGTSVIREDKIVKTEQSTDSEAEFLAKYGVESLAFDNTVFSDDDDVNLPLSERKKIFEKAFDCPPPPIVSMRRSLHERSMSLPAQDVAKSSKAKKPDWKDDIKKEVMVEQIMTQVEDEKSEKFLEKDTEEIIKEKAKALSKIEEFSISIANVREHQLSTSDKPEVLIEDVIELENMLNKTSKILEVKEIHVDKSETEDNEKESVSENQKDVKKPYVIPPVTITVSGKKQTETSSLGESEDTQSESDVTPEEARVLDSEDTPWDVSGTQSGGLSPKDDFYCPKEILEPGIGRWVGQEDLSKQIWEKDDIDTSHFKIDAKWQRTRSESASPKEHYIYTPEEHYPDLPIWEVPVQEQIEKEEMTHDIPIEKQIIVEKDEEEEEEEEEMAHAKKQLIITKEEAKEIAEEILEYIQFEVDNKSSFLTNDIYEDTNNLMSPQLTDQLRQLADKKDLDICDVKVIESALNRDKNDFYKKSHYTIDTATSSIDITDEELRSTGAENDISPVESQICKLQSLDEEDLTMMTAEISKELRNLPVDEESDSLEKEEEKSQIKDAEMLDQTIAEVKESLGAAQEQLIEQHKKRKEDILKKESSPEFEFKNLTCDQFISGEIKERSEKPEGVRECETVFEEGEASIKLKPSKVEDLGRETRAREIPDKKEQMEKDVAPQICKLPGEKLANEIAEKIKFDENVTAALHENMKDPKEMQKVLVELVNTAESDEFSDKKLIEKLEVKPEDQKEEGAKGKEVVHSGEGEVKKKLDEEYNLQKSAKPLKTTEEYTSKQILLPPTITRTMDPTKTVGKISKPLTTDGRQSEIDPLKNLEIQTEAYSGIKGDRCSSEESPRSASIEESTKSAPIQEDGTSTSSIDKHFDTKTSIKLRHSSSAAVLKSDRRSGTDLEPYSSSGESHYHSFEQAPSRPLSSDVEALVAGTVGTAGSSEYESAVSQEVSSKQATSTDYHTAVSSLSSRESIKSLDSESSGNLASVEISSEASETLIQSTLELDKDADTLEMMAYDDESRRTPQIKKTKKPQTNKAEEFVSIGTRKPSADEDFEVISESEIVSWGGEASEDEEGAAVAEEVISDEDHIKKMKRSYEMTFQPEPKPIAFCDSLDEFSKDNFIDKVPLAHSLDESSSILSIPDDRLASSLDDSGSILSTSLSTTSELSAVRTVVELSRTDLERLDESLTVSGTSLDSISRDDFDIKGVSPPRSITNEMSTTTVTPGIDKKLGSVTITTSTSEEHGVSYVSTQVTSISRKSSMVDDQQTERRDSSQSSSEKPDDKLLHANGPTQVDYVPDYDEVETTRSKKPQGHRRKESTSNFVPTMMWNLSEAKPQNLIADYTKMEEKHTGDKYVNDMMLTEKEVKNDEKKEADDSEKLESSLEKYAQERKISEGEEVEELRDYDNRPSSQTSKTDSESGKRPVSSLLSDDRPDSELSDLMKQGSSETEREDFLERPQSPEPEEMENKDITPEFSSEAQASVTELEMEYSSAYSRRDEYASHVSPIREEKSDIYFFEKSTEESLEGEKTHDVLHHQTSSESTIAEKHELETGEKECLERGSLATSPCDVPDITVSEHITPGLAQSSEYFQLKEEVKEKKSSAKTPDTPASTSSRTSSTSTDQGKEYNLEEAAIKKFPRETLSEEKEVSESKDEKESVNSPSSDSFEMLDKPDISDEYVIIEEIGREAQENDQEGKSIEITSKKVTKRPKEEKLEHEEEILESPPAPFTRMTDLKYFPQEADSDLFSFDSESPPQPPPRRFVEKLKRKSSKEEKDEIEFEEQIEQSKKWIEMQFQGEQAAKVIGGYGYEMEYERAPLEDIKEEDLNELDGSSKIGSMGSQKESLGSFSSVKDSFSSTPDYDVLAGRKYFTRSGDHDDVSMSSLQEFELIEKKIMENGKKSGSSSSQDSLSSKKLGTSSKSGQGDDISLASLREFENLENACATVVKMECKAKQEEAILSEIDEGHESQISESESCETVSAVMKEKLESDSEDFDKRMLEIDEIIRQAQSNVEKFSELQVLEKIESMGRGDSYEEVAKVPDLELDMPLPGRSITDIEYPKPIKTTITTQVIQKKKAQQWKELEEGEESKRKPKEIDFDQSPKHSESLSNSGKMKSISVDSLETQAKEKQAWLEGKDETFSLDSYDRKPRKSEAYGLSAISPRSDSIDEVCTSSTNRKSSSGDHSLDTGKEDSGDLTYRQPSRSDFMMGSTDSLDPSSSAATHATYQYETDSVMSSSFTSGDSNTMVSSTDNLEHLMAGQSVIDFSKEFGSSKPEEWLEDLTIREVDKAIQKTEDEKPSALRKFHTATEIQKLIDSDNLEKELRFAKESLEPEEEIIETEEVDKYGKVQKKKILQQKHFIKSDDPAHHEIEKKSDEKEWNTKQTLIQTKKFNLGSDEGFITETVEPLHDGQYSHIVHRRTQMAPEIEKIIFAGPDADKSLREYMENLKTGEEVEETEEVDEHGNVHVKRVIRQRILVTPGESSFKESSKIIRKTIELPPEIKKLSFTGPDAEEAFKKYAESLKPEEEIIETHEEDEYGNAILKKTIKQKILVNLEDMTQEELEMYEKQTEAQHQHSREEHSIQKLEFEGPDAEKALQDYISRLPPEGEIQEIEEVDERGNVHKKKILKQQVVVMPGKLNEDAFEKSQQLKNLDRSFSVKEKIPTQIQKITFAGADAEKQLEDYVAQMEPVEVEVEETDEQGNVHVKKIIKQRVIIRPEELQQNLQVKSFPSSSTEIQKVVFKGSDAEKAMEKYAEGFGSGEDVIEVEEEDDYDNLHLKKVLRQRIVVKSGELNEEGLTEEELEKYLKRKANQTTFHVEELDVGVVEPKILETVESLDDKEFSHVVHKEIQIGPGVQKITFRGPEADKAYKAYVEAFEPSEDVEEIEEVDDEGNVHLKRCVRRKLLIDSEEIEKKGLQGEELKDYLKALEQKAFSSDGHSSESSFDPNISFSHPLTEALTSSPVKLTGRLTICKTVYTV